MLLGGVDELLPVGLLAEEARGEAAEEPDELAGEVHLRQQRLDAGLADEGGDAGRGDERLLGEVEDAAGHLLAGEAARLAELRLHPGAELVEVAEDGLEDVDALQVEQDAAQLHRIHRGVRGGEVGAAAG